MRDQDQVVGGKEGESNGSDILKERAIMELGRTLVLEKFSGIHKDYSS